MQQREDEKRREGDVKVLCRKIPRRPDGEKHEDRQTGDAAHCGEFFFHENNRKQADIREKDVAQQ